MRRYFAQRFWCSIAISLVERSHCQRRTDGRWALNYLRHRLVSHLSSAPCASSFPAHRFWQASHSRNTEADLVAPDLRRPEELRNADRTRPGLSNQEPPRETRDEPEDGPTGSSGEDSP